MPRDAFVLKMQRELCHPKCARKVLGLSRNRPLTHINLFDTKFECFTHVTPQFLSSLTFHSFQIPNTQLEKAYNLEHDKIHFAQLIETFLKNHSNSFRAIICKECLHGSHM